MSPTPQIAIYPPVRTNILRDPERFLYFADGYFDSEKLPNMLKKSSEAIPWVYYDKRPKNGSLKEMEVHSY